MRVSELTDLKADRFLLPSEPTEDWSDCDFAIRRDDWQRLSLRPAAYAFEQVAIEGSLETEGFCRLSQAGKYSLLRGDG